MMTATERAQALIAKWRKDMIITWDEIEPDISLALTAHAQDAAEDMRKESKLLDVCKRISREGVDNPISVDGNYPVEAELIFELDAILEEDYGVNLVKEYRKAARALPLTVSQEAK